MEQELNIPKNNHECVERYPHLKHLYITTNVLSWGKKPWDFSDTLNGTLVPLVTLDLENSDSISKSVSGYHVYTENLDLSCEVLSDVVVHRGECRNFISYSTDNEITELTPDTEVIIRAFAIEHLRKFTGIVSFRTVHKSLYSLSLKPNTDIIDLYNDEMIKSLRKYYKVKS